MLEALKFVLKQLKPHKGVMVLLSLMAIIAAGMDAVVPLLYGRTVDQAIDKDPLASIFLLVVIWMGLLLASHWFRRNLSYHGIILAERIGLEMVSAALTRFLRFPLGFHHDKKSQDTANKIENLRWELSSSIQGIIFDTLPSILTFTAILGFLFYIEWKIGLVLLVTVVAYGFAMRYWVPKEVKANTAYYNFTHEAFATIWDALRNVFVVKSNHGEEFEKVRLERGLRGAVEKVTKAEKIGRWRAAFQDSIITIGSFVGLAIAIYDVWADVLTPGQLTSVLGYIFAAVGFVRWSGWIFGRLTKLQASYEVYKKTLALEEEDYESGDMINIKGGVVFDKVKFRYDPAVKLLERVSFEIAEGERVALVGESGQGKSTIASLLGRFLEPEAGRIFIDGKKVEDVRLTSLREQIAYVPQDLTLFHDTIEKNIRYGSGRVSKERMSEVLKEAQLEKLVKNLPKGVKTIVGERGLKLSAGERQRVAIARAMLRQPAILVLDEPTSNLDAKTEAQIQVALNNLMEGRTTIVIAHRLRTIQHVDRILVLADGKIVEEGTYTQLAARSKSVFKMLLKLQQEK